MVNVLYEMTDGRTVLLVEHPWSSVSAPPVCSVQSSPCPRVYHRLQSEVENIYSKGNNRCEGDL